MKTLADVEAVVPQFSTEELIRLDQFVRQARLRKTESRGRSALDLPPLNLGQMLQPLGSREESFLVAAEVSTHAHHAAARTLASSLRNNGDRFALAPQTLAEFVHIVTDARRFTMPLTVPQALKRAQVWWDAADVDRVWPDESAISWFLAAMARHQLGRKRVLDTLLAGTRRSASITSLLTLNPADFAVFGDFTCVPLTLRAPQT